MMNTPRHPPPQKVQLLLPLVNELCELDCVRDPGQRVMFGQSVGEYLGRVLDLPGRDARSDAVVLVHAVLRQPQDVESGVEALLYAVGLHEGSDVAGGLRERLPSFRTPGPSAVVPLFETFEDKDVNAARALLAGPIGVDRNRLLDRLAHELRLDLPSASLPSSSSTTCWTSMPRPTGCRPPWS